MTFFMTIVWMLTLAATIIASIANRWMIENVQIHGDFSYLCNLYGSENLNTLAAAFVRQIANLNLLSNENFIESISFLRYFLFWLGCSI
jgi:hypothetical protein